MSTSATPSPDTSASPLAALDEWDQVRAHLYTATEAHKYVPFGDPHRYLAEGPLGKRLGRSYPYPVLRAVAAHLLTANPQWAGWSDEQAAAYAAEREAAAVALVGEAEASVAERDYAATADALRQAAEQLPDLHVPSARMSLLDLLARVESRAHGAPVQ